MKLIGANPNAQISGVDPMPAKSNYFIGSDPKQWHTDVPNYAGVELKNVYPGIDLVYHGGDSREDSSASLRDSHFVISTPSASLRAGSGRNPGSGFLAPKRALEMTKGKQTEGSNTTSSSRRAPIRTRSGCGSRGQKLAW